MAAGAYRAGGMVWFPQLLRAAAVLIVAYRHLAEVFWLSNPQVAALADTAPLGAAPDLPHFRLTRLVEAAGLSAKVAVALFFLISGFVIPISLERVGWRRFLAQRVFRVYPTYAVGLGVTCLALYLYARGHGRPFAVTWAEYLANASLFRDWLWVRSLDHVNWTLEMDVKFYLLCAAACAVSTLARARAVLLPAAALAGLAWAAGPGLPGLLAADPGLYRLTYVACSSAVYLTFTLLGVCFYNHFVGRWSGRKAGLVGAALFGLFVVAATHGPAPGGAGVVVRSYAAGLAVFAGCYYWRDRLPYSRPLDWVARVSYPFYVLHAVVGYVLLSVLSERGVPPYGAIALTVPLLFAAAWALHVLVEAPTTALGRAVVRGRRTAGQV